MKGLLHIVEHTRVVYTMHNNLFLISIGYIYTLAIAKFYVVDEMIYTDAVPLIYYLIAE